MPARGGTWQGSHWIRRERRLAIYARDGHRCVWCGNAARALCLDHLDPSGGNGSSNLATACFPCNNRRGDQLVPRWVDRLVAGGADRQEIALRLIAVFGSIDLAAGKALMRTEQDRVRRLSSGAAGRRAGLHLPASDATYSGGGEVVW